jgi:uncharacterized small protein (DUF1192 family)
VDVGALFAALQEEVRRTGPKLRAGDSAVRINARAAAERLWPVSADRHVGGRQGLVGVAYRPAKLVLRKLMRWYLEPALADQRAVNDALLRLIDDLYDEIDRIRAELAELRRP